MNLPPPKQADGATAVTINLLNKTDAGCSNCGSSNNIFLHATNLRGVDHRVCTSCVLRLNPSYFCPICFEFFENPLSSTSSASSYRFLSCVKCSSVTHMKCLPSPPPPPSSFLCPPCSRPKFSFFEIDKTNLVIDKRLASVLLCATQIASALIDKALNVAKAKMETCVREAAAARKRVRDELESSATLVIIKRVERSVQVSGSGNNPEEDKAQKVCTREEVDAVKRKGQMKCRFGSHGNDLSATVYEGSKENRAAAFVQHRDHCFHSTGNLDKKDNPGYHEKVKKSNGELEQKQTDDGRAQGTTLEQA